MAIDFSTIKAITIPEGTVKKIQSGTTVLWQLPKVLSSIAISGYTTSLSRGASFSFGGTVTATYSDGSTANVTSSSTFSGYNMNTAGTYTVTVSYTYEGVTKTATYSLTVTKAWSSIWTGSKTVSITGNYSSPTVSGTASNFAATVTNTGYSPRIRITFSMTSSAMNSSWAKKYWKNDSNTTTAPTSPADITLPTTWPSSQNYTLGPGVAYNDNSSYYLYVMVRGTKDTTNNKVNFSLASHYGTYTGSSSNKASLTITKIEQYY